RSSYDMLAFLFSSNDFNEAFRRMKYLKRYRDYRKDQAEQIRTTQAKLQGEINSLNTEKAKKDLLLTAEEQQKQAIEEDKNKTDRVIKELKGQEKDLTAKILKNRRIQQQIDKAVEEMIRKELELARKKAEEERRQREAEERRLREEEEKRKALAANTTTKPGSNIAVNNNAGRVGPPANTAAPASKPAATATPPKPKPVPSKPAYDYGLTPEAAALSNSFESNRGKLPWPVEKGYISLGFGPYKHPIAEKVTLDNLGVNISTAPGATIRSSFEGTVLKVFTMDGKNWNVLINHGRYSTLYMNLSDVTVKSNQKVSTKQSIGKAAVNEDGESVINFQVWLETKKQNPELWIAR
ncbi:MAG: peptidoglycan DD-metalloendopeptidase family protein, partial [Taibaiella sp.]|nr:peptidoglycan DD-metalloendopeptidase family protein [Taibaiella sp.]